MESTTWLWITNRSIGRSGKIQSLDTPSKLFDLHCGTSKIVQWDNLCKSREGSQVNLCPRDKLKAQGIFRGQTRGRRPRVCLRKIPRAFNLSQGHKFTWLPSRLLHRLSFCHTSPLSNVTLGYSVVNLYPGKRVKVDRLIECNSNQYPGKVDRMCK